MFLPNTRNGAILMLSAPQIKKKKNRKKKKKEENQY